MAQFKRGAASKLYVGNLAAGVRDESLARAFIAFGAVSSARVMLDPDTGRSRGFGIVEMTSDWEADAAIRGMNRQPLEGRQIVVERACWHDDQERAPDGFGGGLV